ncbi:hypothetical protein EJ04DRAFT_548651 [Polyplosphaeria fusca]|uniref:DUF1446-domain-containing protein n=1 Tax=Polyplosphaeria fusca TaxID=682080 RepID=A0A9P4RB04_9PLEO|nr:hypothetical protein EJ04DRAFT_548651 [Polyplosphaeria fusca]
MASDSPPKRAIRIGGASGGFTDRVRAITRLASDPEVDGIVGDWLSENVMTGYGAGKERRRKLELERASPLTFEEKVQCANFASTFLQCFEPAISELRRNGTKLVVNAGANDTELLARVVKKMAKEAGWEARVAWVEGDEVTDQFKAMVADGEEMRNLCDGRTLKEWGFEPICAQAYLGSLGIAEALTQGADVVVCGRVSDAAPTIGLAAWWHGWKADQLDNLAGALVAGHLIECSAFITGGYYSGFKDLMKQKKHLNLGFPIAEVESSGECVIAKEKNTGGVVNTETVTSQLLYEISGPLYHNSDVVANLEDVQATQLGPDRVRVSGINGLPPPPTTRVGITAHGGFQAEWHFYLVGLDMEEKIQWMEEQARNAIGEELMGQFSCLKFQLLGYTGLRSNDQSQDRCTADFRIFAQARDKELFDGSKPDGFARRLYETVLQSCPGVSRSNDLRQSAPKPYFEYFVTLIPQTACNHRVHYLFDSLPSTSIPLPPKTAVYGPQCSYETTSPVLILNYGPTTSAPLGYITLARSGDKASDGNVGFFVRRGDEWDWLRSFLTIEKLKELLGKDWSRGRIDRFEMRNLRAVHFLLKNHLDRGYNSGSGVDTLAKNLGEFLRAKVVDIPVIALTGGASGIGLATCHILASRGATLSIADVNQVALDEKIKEIQSTHGTEVLGIQVDVRKPEQVEAWIKQTVDKFGKLDGAANLAGVIGKSIGVKGVADQDLDDWDFIMDVNLKGVMLCCKYELRAIVDGGSIVNASSIAGLQGRPWNSAYAVSKHGVVGLTRSAAKEVGVRGVRVNCVCPGMIDTPMNATAKRVAAESSADSKQSGSRISEAMSVALRRVGKAEEVAKLVVFLLGDESTFISGASYSVDGGWNC